MNDTTGSVQLKKLAIAGHLQRVDVRLIGLGYSRADRDEILNQIADQFHDTLGDGEGMAAVNGALARLPQPESFGDEVELTTVELARRLWLRVTQPHMVPVVVNDGGSKRVLWRQLLTRLGWMYLVLISGTLVAYVLLRGSLSVSAGLIALLATLGFGLLIGLWIQIRQWPVESLPLAEHVMRQAKNHRAELGWVAFASGCWLLALLTYPLVYVLAAAITGQPVWPISHPLAEIVVFGIGGMFILLSLAAALAKRANRRRINAIC